MTNSRISQKTVFEDLDALLTAYVLSGNKESPRPGIPLTQDQLKEFEGYYQADNPRDQIFDLQDELAGGIEIRAEKGALHVHPYPLPINIELVALPGNQFYAKGQQLDGSAIIGHDELGNYVLSIDEMFVPGSHAVRVSAFWPKLRAWLFIAALLAAISAIAYALFWIPAWLVRKIRHRPGAAVVTRVAPLTASLCVLSFIYTYITISGWKWCFPTPEAILFWLSGWGLLICSVLAIAILVRKRLDIHGRLSRIHSWVVAVACSGLVIFFSYWHLIGFRSWIYR
jgi:hypothetical protein